MKQNLSAEGTLEAWISASEEALWNAKFVNIDYDPKTRHLSGDIGRKGSIGIDFSIQADGRTRLEITTTDADVLDRFKREVTRTFLAQARAAEEAAASEAAEDDAYGDDAACDDAYGDDEAQDDDWADTTVTANGPAAEDPEAVDMASGSPWSFRDFNGRLQIPAALKNAQCYHKVWFIVLMLVVLPPVGIFLMYYYRRFRIFPRIVITIVAFLYTILVWVGIFGVNTGLNEANIDKWYNQQRSQIVRIFNLNTAETPLPEETTTVPSTSETTGSDATASESAGTSGASESDDRGFLETFSENMKGLFGGN